MSAEMQFFKVDGYNVLHGSLRKDTPVEKCVWLSLMAMCSLSRVWGIIAANNGESYDDEYLAFMCNVTMDDYANAISHHISMNRLNRLPNGSLQVINWDKYQTGNYARQRRLRDKEAIKEMVGNQPPVTNVTPPSDKKNVIRIDFKNRIELNTLCKDRFCTFWSSYPKKKAKQDAIKAFMALDPSDELLATIVADVNKKAVSDEWTRDNKQYIPLPATYLRGKRWEDEEIEGANDTIESITVKLRKEAKEYYQTENLTPWINWYCRVGTIGQLQALYRAFEQDKRRFIHAMWVVDKKSELSTEDKLERLIPMLEGKDELYNPADCAEFVDKYMKPHEEATGAFLNEVKNG